MLIGEIIEQLNDGNNLKQVAKELHVGGDTLRNKIKTIGYIYNNKNKVWEYQGEGEPPTTTNIVDLIGKKSPRKTQGSHSQGDKDTAKVKAPNTTKELTNDDIDTLKAIVSNYKDKTSTQQNAGKLYERLLQMDLEKERTRKTVFLNEDIAEQFDDFTKRNRLNKSDVMELALIDLMNTYK